MDGKLLPELIVVAVALVTIVCAVFLRVRARRETAESVLEIAFGKTEPRGDIALHGEVRAPIGIVIKGKMEERARGGS